MDTESIRGLCNALPGVTEDIKWGNDLCFLIGGKMFCVISLETPIQISFKAPDEEFDELSNSPGIIPAPYAARHKWVLVNGLAVFTKDQWRQYISQSYQLVRAKLSKKAQARLDEKG